MHTSDNKLTPYLLVAPAFILIVLFIFYPILNSVLQSFVDSNTGGWTLDNYKYFFTEKIQQQNMVYTFKIVLGTVLLTLLVSYSFAILLRFSNSWFSKAMGSMVLLPRFIPGLVAVQSMLILINAGGVISRLASWFGIEFNLAWIYSWRAILLMNLWFNIPFSTLIILSALSNVKDSFIDSAKDIGASPFSIFHRIIFPLTYKSLILSGTFVFLSNLGSFTTPYLLGGTHPKMLGVVVFEQFNTYYNHERAAALSVIMFLFSSLASIIYIWSNMKKKVWEES